MKLSHLIVMLLFLLGFQKAIGIEMEHVFGDGFGEDVSAEELGGAITATGASSNKARETAERICKKAASEYKNSQPADRMEPESGEVGTVFEKDGKANEFHCQCTEEVSKKVKDDKLNCDPAAQEEEEEEGDGENPFECAGGGGGGEGDQAAQQYLQQRAQLENQCNQSYEQSRVACDPNSAVGFQGMLDEAMAKANRAKEAGDDGLKKACDEYTKAFEKASSELKQFRSSCANAKASCISSCKQSIVKNAEANPILSAVAGCLGPLGGILAALAKGSASIEQVQIKDCTSFERVLKEADQKQQELIDSMRAADKCQTELEESCSANPSSEKCRQLETRSLDDDKSDYSGLGADLDRADTNVNLGGPAGQAAIAPTKLEKSSVNGGGGSPARANLGGGGGGGAGGGASGARGNGGGGYYSQYDDLYNSMKGDSFSKARRGGGSSGSSYRPKSRNRVYRRKPARKSGKGSGIDLKKYMNGGTGRQLTDGITPASGPGIFEKVTNRFQVEKRSLDY